MREDDPAVGQGAGPTVGDWNAAAREGPQPFVVNPRMVGAGDTGTPITPEGPLAEGEPEGIIAPSPLWAMKVCRHFQWSHLLPHAERHERVRTVIGTGADAVAVIDDGHQHRIIGRHVGQTADGCSYSLVARITTDECQRLASGSLRPVDAFLHGANRALYAVVEDGPASNVFLVGTFGAGDVPSEYLPGNEPITFAEALGEF